MGRLVAFAGWPRVARWPGVAALALVLALAARGRRDGRALDAHLETSRAIPMPAPEILRSEPEPGPSPEPPPEVRCCPCAMREMEREDRKARARRLYQGGQRERRIIRKLCERDDYECRQDVTDALVAERVRDGR